MDLPTAVKESSLFENIWAAIKHWDVETKENEGYHGITGDDVRVIINAIEDNRLTASEAIYGFCGWLTLRAEKTVMSAIDDCAPIVDLIKQFCDENKLEEPREHWVKNLTHPRVIKVLEKKG